jgi:bile acid:Na+ symporter, BASS family
MNIDQLVSNISALTLIAMMLAMGLNLTFEQVISIWRQPKLLIISLVSVLLVIPVVAVIIVKVFPLQEADTVAILLAAAVAGSGSAPKLAEKAGGNVVYAVSLMATLCILAIVTAPLTISLLLKGQGSLSPIQVAQTVLFSQLLPLFVGLAIHTWWKSLRDVIVGPVNKLSNVLFPVMILLVLVNDFQSIVALLGSTGLLAIVILVVISLAVGHLLGGQRTRPARCSPSPPVNATSGWRFSWRRPRSRPPSARWRPTAPCSLFSPRSTWA